MQVRRGAATLVTAVVAVTGLGVSAAAAAPGAPGKRVDQQPGSTVPVAVPAAGTFYPLAPSRLLGTATEGYALEPGSGVGLAPGGLGGVPASGVSAVVVNVLVVAGPGDAALTFAPSGAGPTPPPLLAVPGATTRSVLLTLPLGPDGTVQVTSTGSARLTADVVGFYAADDTVIGGRGVSGGYQPLDVTRILDTGAQPLAPGDRRVLDVDLGSGATPHATALLVRVTATGGPAAGTLTVGAPGEPVPSVSFPAGAAASNLAVVPATPGDGGRLDVAVVNGSAAATGVLLDVVGFYDDGGLGPNLRFRALPQTRVVDSGTGQGAGVLQPGASGSVTPAATVVGDSTFGLVGVLAAAPQGGPAALEVGDPDAPAPETTPVTLPAGPSSVAVQPEVGSGRELALGVAEGSAPTAVTLDVTGSFEAYPAVTNPTARGWVPAVPSWQVTTSER